MKIGTCWFREQTAIDICRARLARGWLATKQRAKGERSPWPPPYRLCIAGESAGAPTPEADDQETDAFRDGWLRLSGHRDRERLEVGQSRRWNHLATATAMPSTGTLANSVITQL